MGITKRELIRFLDGLVELASEENQAKVVLIKERFISAFEKDYACEKEVMEEDKKVCQKVLSKWKSDIKK